ncbi:hypothetical protein M8J75_014226 [Diaphorina citri]|nr:hypothetical protein M8J75_014226 [Diaphorina citri]
MTVVRMFALIFCLACLLIATVAAQQEEPTSDETGLSPNYKPSVKLDPRLRKALLRVLTKLDQEDNKPNEVSIRDINSQVGSPHEQYQQNQQQFQTNQQSYQPNQRADSPSGPSASGFQPSGPSGGFRPVEGTSTHTPVSIYQDYSKLTQQPVSSAVPPTAPTVATPDYERLYQQFQNLQKVETAAQTGAVDPTQPTNTNTNVNQNGSSNIVALTPQQLEAFYKQQAAGAPPQGQDIKNLIPEFVDFNQNFISNQEDGEGEKLSKALGYKIIKFDKNDKESINSFLQNNNIEIISSNGGKQVNPSQLGQNDILLSNFNEHKEILLSSLNVNKGAGDAKGNAEAKTNDINESTSPKNEVQQKPKDVLPTPNDSLISNEDLYKTVILSNKAQPDNGGNAIFYNPNNIIGPSGKEGEIFDTKPPSGPDNIKDIPTYTEEADKATNSNSTNNKTSEVQFFSVPLVAAFTLQQNSFGIPQKVIPLNYLDNGEYISEDRVKSIEENIILNKQRQKIAETANNTKELEELKSKQEYLEREKVYVDEKLREFRQNESKEKLIQQQSIGLQTANLEQYLQKFNREPKYNSDFASLQFGNQNLEQKKQQLQEQFAREAELEKYKKLELEKIQELNRLEKYRQFEKNLRQFEQTESSASTIPQLNSRPQEIQPFTPSFSPLVNFDNLPPVDFQKSINLQYSQYQQAQPSFSTAQPGLPVNQPSFSPNLRAQQPAFPTNVPTFSPQPSFQPQPSFAPQPTFQNNIQPNFVPNVPRGQPTFEPRPNFDKFNQQQNFVPSQQLKPAPPQFNPNPFQQIPRQNFQPNFQPNGNNFITSVQFPQLGNNFQQPGNSFQQGRNFPVDSFRPSQFQFQPPTPQFQNFQQPFGQQPFLSNNRIVRKEPFQSVGNFGVNNFVLPPTKSNTFKRNVIPPSRVLEPPFV